MTNVKQVRAKRRLVLVSVLSILLPGCVMGGAGKLETSTPPKLTELNVIFEARPAKLEATFPRGRDISAAKAKAQAVNTMISNGLREDLPKQLAGVGVTVSPTASHKLVLFPESYTSNCMTSLYGYGCNMFASIKGVLTDHSGRVIWTYSTTIGSTNTRYDPANDWPEFSSSLIASLKSKSVI